MLRAGCIKECPGCHHREMTEEASLKQKEEWLKKILPRPDVFTPVKTLHGEDRWGYRKKVTLNTEYAGRKWKFGMKVRDELIDISDCPVHHEMVRKTIGFLARILPPSDVFPLAFFVQYGAQVVLIVKSKGHINKEWMTEEVIFNLKATGIEGFWIHKNPSAGKRLFEKTPLELIFGNNISFENNMAYGIGAFQQLVESLYRDSLQEAESFFDANGSFAIVDLYSGSGRSLALWEKRCETTGIELNGFSCSLAALNAPRSKILRGKCSERIPQIDEWIQSKQPDHFFVYANPPRTGFEPEITAWIIRNRPAKIAYLSCSAGTLRRDLEALTGAGYEIMKIIPYDFFPQTRHIETLVLLEYRQTLFDILNP